MIIKEIKALFDIIKPEKELEDFVRSCDPDFQEELFSMFCEIARDEFVLSLKIGEYKKISLH